jgi:hypothetical protein
VPRHGTQEGPGGLALRTTAHLDHVVLTHEPAYPGARVMAIRTADQRVTAWRREAARHHQLLDRLHAGG